MTENDKNRLKKYFEELLDDLEPGDYVMVHAGVAIAKITDDDAEETMGIMQMHAR